jgi:hypothetical protein
MTTIREQLLNFPIRFMTTTREHFARLSISKQNLFCRVAMNQRKRLTCALWLNMKHMDTFKGAPCGHGLEDLSPRFIITPLSSDGGSEPRIIIAS